MRNFEFARNMEELKNGNTVKAFEKAEIPEYQTTRAAGADFFAAVDTDIPSVWAGIWKILKGHTLELLHFKTDSNVVSDIEEVNNISKLFNPTLIHTGIKACMNMDEVLYLYNRSSNPKKLGLILANSVGVIDADYYDNPDNDGEIMFAYLNIKPWTVHIKAGDRIGQGVFQTILRPTGDGLRIKNVERSGGFGSTNTK